jgi:hypothetical protein
MFDDILTDDIKSRIFAANKPVLKKDEFAKRLVDQFGDLTDKDTFKIVASYVADNWPEDYRKESALANVPWTDVFASIDVESLSQTIRSDYVGRKPLGLTDAQKTIDDVETAKGYLTDLTTAVRNYYVDLRATQIAQETGVSPEDAIAKAEAAPSSSLITAIGLDDIEESTVESELATRPGADISSIVATGVAFETPLDLSALPGFDLLEVTDQWTAADTLSYITDIDQTARMKLQDLLEGAGYFDQAREMGHVSARDGTNDVATQVAWQQFLADAVINGETNMQSWLTERTRTMRSRSMASVQEVYRDPASINTLIDSVSMELLGRTLDVQERSSLLGKLMDWQREALLGPTYTQERYDVDLQARAKEFFDKQFMKERMQNRTDEFLYKIGALGG